MASKTSGKSEFLRFQKAYPSYRTTEKIDKLRTADFTESEQTGEVYLDYTGGGRYSKSQLRTHMKLLESTVFGNPHSVNPSSQRSTDFMEEARAEVCEFFNANSAEYEIIFTPNASGALRLVAESYPFAKGGHFLQLIDNHNSVNGIREYARRAGAIIDLVPTQRPAMRARQADVEAALADHTDAPHLFAYPAQSNFTGVQHPLNWIETARQQGWDVVLDAAAFVPTNQLDLREWKPDFVPISFYKIFGWPTGVGCLIARKTALAQPRRPWFAGGTIWAVNLRSDWHIPAPSHESFEDGTVNYLNLPAVTFGLKYIRQIGIDTIHTRVECLTGWLLREMSMLTHPNGKPMIEIYGPHTTEARGGTIAFNFLDPSGKIVDERIVEKLANKHKISLRAGCICNPGSGEIAFDLPVAELPKSHDEVRLLGTDHFLKMLGMQSGGAIRISLGLVSNFADTQAFLRLAEEFRGQVFGTRSLAKRDHC